MLVNSDRAYTLQPAPYLGEASEIRSMDSQDYVLDGKVSLIVRADVLILKWLLMMQLMLLLLLLLLLLLRCSKKSCRGRRSRRHCLCCYCRWSCCCHCFSFVVVVVVTVVVATASTNFWVNDSVLMTDDRRWVEEKQRQPQSSKSLWNDDKNFFQRHVKNKKLLGKLNCTI